MYCTMVDASCKSFCLIIIIIIIITTANLCTSAHPNYIHVKRKSAKLSTLNDLYKISYTVHTKVESKK